jgi:uncharacterized protein
MSEELLEKTIKEIAALHLEHVEFNWHGGEPLLAGIEFYKKAKELQQKYIGDQTIIRNSIQTNGTLITEEWVNFFIDYNFGVGISLDGPEEIHDSNRCFKSGKGSFSFVMKGIKTLQNRIFDICVIPVVTEPCVDKAKYLFDFFVNHRINHFAFTPCNPKRDRLGKLPDDKAQYIISPDHFGRFMINIYDLWMGSNNPEISIRYLKQITKILLGGYSTLCLFKKGQLCYQFLTINTNGNIYPCDSYMSENFLFGNIKFNSLKEVMLDSSYKEFSQNVIEVPEECKCCLIYEICGGGCSFYRYFQMDNFNHKGYYCDSTKMIVDHISDHIFKHDIPTWIYQKRGIII